MEGASTCRRRGGAKLKVELHARAELAGRFFSNLEHETKTALGRYYNGICRRAVSNIIAEYQHGAKRLEALNAAAKFYERNPVPGATTQTEHFSRPGPTPDATAKARKRTNESIESDQGGYAEQQEEFEANKRSSIATGGILVSHARGDHW